MKAFQQNLIINCKVWKLKLKPNLHIVEMKKTRNSRKLDNKKGLGIFDLIFQILYI